MPPCPLAFILRYRLPPRRFFTSASGTGSTLAVLAGGGSCHFSIFFTISSFMVRPAAPLGSCTQRGASGAGGSMAGHLAEGCLGAAMQRINTAP